MKVKVNRQLKAGKYHVNFEVSDFTPDEVGKMSSFGVPTIEMVFTTAAGQTRSNVALTQISSSLNASFGTEEAARAYEQKVLTQIRAEVERLRDSKDAFSSSQEVEL